MIDSTEPKKRTKKEGARFLPVPKGRGLRANTMAIKQIKKPFLWFFIIDICITWGIFLHHGVIGSRQDWAFPVNAQGMKLFLQEAVHDWNAYALGSVQTYPTDAPFLVFLGLLGYLHIRGSWFVKLFLFAVVWLSGVSAYVLMDYIIHNNKKSASNASSFISGIFYMLTPLLYNKIIAGHTDYILAYAVSPLIVLSFFKANNWNRNKKDRFVQWLIVLLLFEIAGFQIQYFVMMGIILFILTFQAKKIEHFWRAQWTFWSLVLGLILLNAFWLIFQLSHSDIQTLSIESSTLSWIIAQSNHWYQDIGLTGYFDDYFTWRYNQIVVEDASAYLLLVFILYGVVKYYKEEKHKKETREITTWVLIALIGLFCANGDAPPLGSLYAWMFMHFSILSMFREIYHWMFIPAFSYTVLLGYAYEKLLQPKEAETKVETKAETVLGQDSKKSKKSLYFNISFFILLCVYTFPFWINGLGQDTTSVSYSADFLALNQRLAEDPLHRVIWMPAFQPGYWDGDPYEGIDLMNQFSPEPTMLQEGEELDSGDHMTYFLYQQILDGNNPLLGQLLSFYDVQRIIYRSGFTSHFYKYTYLNRYPSRSVKWTNDAMYQTLNAVTDTTKYTEEGFADYENNETSQLFSVADQTLHVAGDLSAISDITSLPGSVAQHIALFWGPASSQHWLFVNNDRVDAVLSQAQNVGTWIPGNEDNQNDDAAQGFAPLYYWWWYNDAFAGATNDGIFSQKKGAIYANTVALHTGKQPLIMWANVYRSIHTGKVRIQVLYGTKIVLNTVLQTQNKNTAGSFQWMEVGTISNPGTTMHVVITNLNKETALEKVIWITQKSWQQASARLSAEIQHNPVWIAENASENEEQGMNVQVYKTGDYTVYTETKNQSADVWSIQDHVSLQKGDLHLKNPHIVRWVAIENTTYQPVDAAQVTNIQEKNVDRYLVQITEHNGPRDKTIEHPALLVFKTNYDVHWIATENGRILQHIKVDGYANGFIVPVDTDAPYNTQQTVIIQYDQQNLYFWLLMLSIGGQMTGWLFLFLFGIARIHAKTSQKNK